MVFVPTLDVDAHAGRVWARELGSNSLLPVDVVVDARFLGAGPPHAASAPACSTALVGV